MIIRLWGKAPGNTMLTPASFSVDSEQNPDEFIRCLNDIEHGWIVVIGASTDPNRLTKEQLINMAREIIDHNGVKLLLAGQDKQGNKIWLSQNFAEYEQRLLTVDWSRIGYIDAKPKTKPPVSTEKRQALQTLQASLESESKTIPSVVSKMAEKYQGSVNIPKALLTKLEEWYTVELVNGQYQIKEKS